MSIQVFLIFNNPELLQLDRGIQQDASGGAITYGYLGQAEVIRYVCIHGFGTVLSLKKTKNSAPERLQIHTQWWHVAEAPSSGLR